MTIEEFEAEMQEDGLTPARGFLFGVLAGLVFWGVVVGMMS